MRHIKSTNTINWNRKMQTKKREKLQSTTTTPTPTKVRILFVLSFPSVPFRSLSQSTLFTFADQQRQEEEKSNENFIWRRKTNKSNLMVVRKKRIQKCCAWCMWVDVSECGTINDRKHQLYCRITSPASVENVLKCWFSLKFNFLATGQYAHTCVHTYSFNCYSLLNLERKIWFSTFYWNISTTLAVSLVFVSLFKSLKISTPFKIVIFIQTLTVYLFCTSEKCWREKSNTNEFNTAHLFFLIYRLNKSFAFYLFLVFI